jgi:hypothetical protein
MLSKQDLSRLYDTVLSTPGMQDVVKVDLRIQRKNVLLLSKIIERGLKSKETIEKEDELLVLNKKEALEELQKLVDEILIKAGLKEMIEKLDSFL